MKILITLKGQQHTAVFHPAWDGTRWTGIDADHIGEVTTQEDAASKIYQQQGVTVHPNDVLGISYSYTHSINF